jgi:hypothetical protein
MLNLVIPEAIKEIQLRLQVTSNEVIPPFDPVGNFCDDTGKIQISSTYKSTTTNADFILFLGAINEENSTFMAYSNYCLLGIYICKF